MAYALATPSAEADADWNSSTSPGVPDPIGQWAGGCLQRVSKQAERRACNNRCRKLVLANPFPPNIFEAPAISSTHPTPSTTRRTLTYCPFEQLCGAALVQQFWATMVLHFLGGNLELFAPEPVGLGLGWQQGVGGEFGDHHHLRVNGAHANAT